MSRPGTLAFIIKGSRVEHAPVIPDGQVVGVLPPEPDLEVVVVRDELDEPAQQIVAFGLTQAVDPLGVVTNGEDGLPTGDLRGHGCVSGY